MTGRDLPHVAIAIPLLFTELFQSFFSELAKISQLHSSTIYNIQNTMSREKNINRRWGHVLAKLRNDAGFTQAALAKQMGYPKGKGKISEIESGKLPIAEEKIRLWVSSCGKTMFDFYVELTRFEGGSDLIQPYIFPKKPR